MGTSRLIGMLAAGLLVMALSSRCAHAQPVAVTISDRVLNPDGTGWTGMLALTAPGMICNGAPIGPTKLTFMVSGGTIIPAMALFPLADCSPGYPYTVTYSGTSRGSFFWWIHASPATTTIGAVQTDSALTPLMQLSWSQFPAGTVAGQVPTWNGSSWGLVVGGGGGGPVSSVFGRIGAVTAQTGDYTTAQVAESGNLYFTNARAAAATAALYQTPLTWLGSGISGALDQILGSAAQKPVSYFEPAIAAGTASQVFLGNKTWAAISSLALSSSQVTTALGYTPQTPITLYSTISGLSGYPSSFTPSAHASTHASAGSDPLTLSESQIANLAADLAAKEPALGNPGTSGYVLSSTTAGVRSWIANGSGGSMIYPGTGVPSSTGSAWGASYTVGSGAGNLVQLNGSSQLPAVSAALLTNWPTFNQNTTGTAAGLSAAFIDWNASSGGAFIQNKPTIPAASSATPLMDGTAAAGTGTTWARADHIHPTDTTRQAALTVYSSISGLSGYPSSWLPSAHAASHQYGGADLVGTATPAANAIPMAGSGGTLAAGWIPTLNQNTTGTAAGLSAAYIDWNASSGGPFVQNKPTIPAASSTTPIMDGTAAIGSAATYAKADHVHPTDTSRMGAFSWPASGSIVQVSSGAPMAATAHSIDSNIVCASTTASSSSTAYSCSTPLTFTPAAGDLVIWDPGTNDLANTTTTPTLNVNGAGAVTIWKQAANAAVAVGDVGSVATSSQFLMLYDGTYWEVASQTGTAPGGGMTNPMTTLGDIIYENSTPAPARLAGNTTSTMYLLSQTGTGTVSAVPAWKATTGAGAYIPTVNNTSTFNTTAAATYTFPAASGTLPAIGSTQTWTALQTFNSAGAAFTSGSADAFRVIAGAAYSGSNDGAFNRNNATTPAMMQVYESSTGIAKNVTLPSYVTFSATGASAAVSATTLFTPSTAALQIWAVDAAVVQKTPGTACSGSFTVTVNWTDDGGSLNSYSLATFAWASANAAASGASNGTRADGHKLIQQTSTTAPTYAVSIPTGCTGMAYDWSVSAARIG
jgi:hypothetical protein